VEIYGRVDPGLDPELMQRRQRLARYHAMLAKTALQREKANPNRPARGASDGDQLAFAGF
jgi:hypothetical protein